MASITACRSCGSAQLHNILSLGSTPLANALLSETQLSEPEAMYPLELIFCAECSLVQLTETVPPEQLFKNYFYFSSYSDTMILASKALAERLISQHNLGNNSLVVEIASNDGYLLQHYVRCNVPVLGVEPAENVARVAQERGIRTLCEFFGSEFASNLVAEGYKADIVHANNVLAHVADLNGVIAGIAQILKDTGTAVIETPYVRDMIDNREFDTIYHEHLCYYSLIALDRLFRRHQLLITDVEHLDIHGGSLRIFVTKSGTPSQFVRELLDTERQVGLDQLDYYLEFGNKVSEVKEQVKTLIENLKRDGMHIAVYGASAKGATLLNYFNIGHQWLDFVVDRSMVKQGYYTPGTHLPILNPQVLVEKKPDYVLLLTWNFADEILEQQATYRIQGGKFIIPIPEVRII